VPPDRLKDLAVACARKDIRLVINTGMSPHALDVLEQVDREIPLKDRRWILGHIGDLDSREIERIARLGLSVGLHINAALYKFGDEDLRQLPPDRRQEIAPLRTLLSAGINVAFESDNVPISPFWPVWQAVARPSRSNQRIAPEQAITVTEALRCASFGGAYLNFDEKRLGSLEEGKLADLAIIDTDPMSAAEDELRDIRSLATMVGGTFVYLRESSTLPIRTNPLPGNP
jgi:predicted amidohydrolase YtcJ